MNTHLIWLWFWYSVGMGLYMLKRMYFLVTGPNPVANNYKQFWQRCWVPLLIRAAIDSAIFWMCFTPQLLPAALNYLGWSNFGWVASVITQFGPCAFFFGHTVDSIVDLAVTKIPFLNGFLPQMPAPLPSKSPTNLQVAAQQAANKE
jgi:hypothetical protein